MLKLVAIAATMAAILSPTAAQASTVTTSTGQVQVFLAGTDSATLTFSDGVSLAPTTRVCSGRTCRWVFPITGSSINCSSSSYTSSYLNTWPTLLFTMRSAVACQFSYTVRVVGSGTVTVNGVSYAI